jgi:hypothetical protein
VSPPARALPLVLALPLAALALHDGGASLDARSVVGIALWSALLLALALSLAPRAPVPRAATACLALFGAYAAFTGLSALWAPSAERAVVELDRHLLHLAILALPVAFARWGEAGRWADGLALGVVAIALLALAQRLFPGLLPDDDLASALPEAATRLTYPIGYWNGLAVFVALAVPLLLRIATSDARLAVRAAALAPFPVLAAVIYLTSSRGGVAVAVAGAAVFVVLGARRLAALQAVAVAAAGSAAAIAVLSGRRALVDGPFDAPAAESQGGEAALLIVLVGLAAAALFAVAARVLPAKLDLPRPAAAASGALAIVVLLTAVAAADPAQRVRDFKAVPADADPSGAVVVEEHLRSSSGSGRWQFWDAALEQFAEHPIGGQGAGSYEAWWAEHGTIDWFVRNAHSLWLETLGELGVVGLALLLGAFVAAVAGGAARLRGAGDGERDVVAALIAVVAAFAVGAALDWVWQLPAVAGVALVAAGLLARASAEPPGPGAGASRPGASPARPRSPDAPAARPMPFPRRAALVVGAWFAICASLPPFLAAEQLEASRRAAARDDVAAALEHAASARAIEPWAASPYTQLALIHEGTGDLAAARDRIGQAVERDERDWRLHVIAARLATKAGDIPAARAALRRARALNPRSPALRPRR